VATVGEDVLAAKLTLWTVLVLVLVALGYLGVGLFIAARLSARGRRPEERTPADLGLEFNEIRLESTDELTLAGWWVPGDDPSRAVLLVPGLESEKSEEHILETAVVYARAGYAVLMVDLRAQGGSEGERISMGYHEVWDVRGALRWLEERGFAPGRVVLHGFSMGGATVLRAASGTGVAAVLVEASYSDLPLVLRERLPQAGGLPPFFVPGVMLAARLFLGIDPWAVRPEEDARKLYEEGVPFMIIHSTSDEVVPFEHAKRLESACPEATFWRMESYEHVGAYAHPEYGERLLGFLQRTTSAEGS
jgi:uncharacterized protein